MARDMVRGRTRVLTTTSVGRGHMIRRSKVATRTKVPAELTRVSMIAARGIMVRERTKVLTTTSVGRGHMERKSKEATRTKVPAKLTRARMIATRSITAEEPTKMTTSPSPANGTTRRKSMGRSRNRTAPRTKVASTAMRGTMDKVNSRARCLGLSG